MKKPLIDYLKNVPDPRVNRTKVYSLDSIAIMTICGTIVGQKNWQAIADWAKAEQAWLLKAFDINRIPSHDTFGRLFSRINPRIFARIIQNWSMQIVGTQKIKVISLDGKTIKGSRDENDWAIHLILAWATEIGLVIGSREMTMGYNEVHAMHIVLEQLILDGVLVCIDAIATRPAIAQQITDVGGDYLLPLKENNKDFLSDVSTFFKEALVTGFADVEYTKYYSIEKGHGRIEKRTTYVIHDIDWLEQREKWPKLKSLIMTQRERRKKGTIETSIAYHISSRQAGAEQFAGFIRGHWNIENGLNHVLDVVFDEDKSRVRKGFGAHNMNTIRCLALGMLNHKKTNGGISSTMRLAANCREHLNVFAKLLLGET